MANADFLTKPPKGAPKPWQRPAAFAAVASLFVFLIYSSPLRPNVDRIARGLEFQARLLLRAAPQQDPAIKILSFDDATLSKLKSDELTHAQWGALIRYLSAHKVRAILIDKIFGLPPIDDVAAVPLQSALKESSPVIVGAFYTDSPIQGRPQLAVSSRGVTIEPGAATPLETTKLIYGPDPAYAESFQNVGLLLYEGHGAVPPYIAHPNGGAVMAAGMLVSDDIRLKKDGLFVGKSRVPLDHRGLLQVNFFDFRTLKNFSLQSLLPHVEKNAMLPKSFGPGDVVIVLPYMFTGNSDYKDTPVGKIPGGLLQASIANSAISGKWLRYSDFGLFGILVSALVGAFLSARASAVRFAFTLSFTALAITATALVAFSHFSIMSDWLFLTAAFALSGAFTFIDKSRRHEKLAAKTREALSGLVAPGRLEQIIANPSAMRFDPVEKALTLMFVDIVGFSSIAERKTAREVFDNLKRTLGRIAAAVHSFDGYVDRTLGDGLLCYFGYVPGGTSNTGNHADRAVACAMLIQKESIGMTLSRLNDEDPVFPLRIGINTANVFLGDLGDGHRLDYTVIGHGVNITQRLESACEPFRIMISDATRQLATSESLETASVERRMIQIKHHKEAMEAYELTPRDEEHLPVAKAQVIYFKFRGIERVDQRWQVPEGVKILFVCEFGDAELVNYSRLGFSVLMKTYLGKGLETKFDMVSARSEQHVMVSTIHGEVRWGRPAGDGRYLHGVLIKHLPDLELDLLLHQLHAMCRAKGKRSEGSTPEQKPA